jgi:GTP cyclohydrolase II
MLPHLDIDRMRLLTNSPAKVKALAREGIIIGRISLPPLPVPAMAYAVLSGKFPVRICRELNLSHEGFCAFARAKSGAFEAGK